mgnify:FL=1
MQKLRVVQVGAGRFTHADHTMQAMRSMPDYYDVVGVCEPNEKARALAMPREAYRDMKWLELDDVLRDHTLDALIVETDELDQARTALMAAQAGFAVHMDKPGGEDIQVFEQLVETVKRKNLVFQSGYMLRYNPAVVKLLETIRAGKLGDILCVEAQMSPPRYGRAFAQDVMSYMKGGMAYYLGCHLMDLVYLIKGAPLEVIPMNACTGARDTDGLDYGFVAYRYKEGVSFIKTTSSEVSGVVRRQLIVSGTKGTAEIEPLEGDTPQKKELFCTHKVSLRLSFEKDDASAWTTENYDFPPYGRYTEMMIDFARMVRGETKNVYTPDYELAVFRLLLESCGLNQ